MEASRLQGTTKITCLSLSDRIPVSDPRMIGLVFKDSGSSFPLGPYAIICYIAAIGPHAHLEASLLLVLELQLGSGKGGR